MTENKQKQTKLKILVYEDDKNIEKILREALSEAKQNGYVDEQVCIDPVILADKSSFESWLANFRDSRTAYSFAIMDIKIGTDINEGYRATNLIRSEIEHKDCPIVMFSKSCTDDARLIAYNAGATSFVRKPPTNKKNTVTALSNILKFWVGTNLENPLS